MNFRLTAILFGVVFLMVVGLLVYALTAPDPSREAAGPFAALTAAGVKADMVDTVEIRRTEPRPETLVFERRGDAWRLTAPTDAGADPAALNALVRALLDLTPTEYAEALDKADVGLARPTVTVTLRGGGVSAAAHVGNTTSGKDAAVTFFLPADDPNARPMAVPTRAVRATLFRPGAIDGAADTLVKWRSDFRTRSLLGLDPRDPESEVTALALARGDKRLALAQAGGEWRFTQPAEYGSADAAGSPDPDSTRFTGVRPLLNAVLFLQTSGSADVTEDVPPADLPKYGLADADKPLRVELTPKGRAPRTVFIGNRVPDPADGRPQGPPRHYCRVDGDAAVFVVTTDAVGKLAATLDDPSALRNRDLLPPDKLAKIDAVKSTVGGGYELRRVGVGADSRWVLYGRPGDPTDANLQQVQAMLGRLSAPRAAGDVLPKPDDAAFDGPNLQGELTVWFTETGKKPTELKDGKAPADPPAPTGEPITLRVGRNFSKKVPRGDGLTLEQAMTVVRRVQGKDATDFEVPQDLALAALLPRLRLVNARPPSFPPSAATRLTLFRDGTRTEYVKTAARDTAYERSGAWTVGENGPVADGDGVADVLTRLSTLPATLVMESADDLKALGLDPANPKMSATVAYTVDKAAKEEAYHFGEPVKGDDKSVYMKAVGKPHVYAVPADTAARLRTADLTDKVVFRAPRERLKSIELTGWADGPDKKAVTVKAELQNGTWAGEKVDPAAVEGWALALRHPKAIGPAPVEKGKAPPPEYGFATSVLVIAVLKAEKEGEKDTSVSLLLGGLNADRTGVYAQVNGQEYRLLDARPFAPLLAKPPTR